MYKSYIVLLSLIACFLLLTGCQQSEQAEKKAPILTPVRIQTAKRVTTITTTTQPATVHAYYQAKIYAQVAGRLNKLHVDIGDEVALNKPLAEIYVPELQQEVMKCQEEYKLALENENRVKALTEVASANIEAKQALQKQAEANVVSRLAKLKASEKELNRVRELVESKSLASRLLDEAEEQFESAQADRDSAKAALTSAKEELEVAKSQHKVAKSAEKIAALESQVRDKKYKALSARLGFAVLKAPFSGIVVERNVDLGDLVRNSETQTTLGKPLFVIAKVDKLRIHVPVPEADAALVKQSANVVLQFPSLREEKIKATVTRIAGSLDDTSRTMLVEIVWKNKERKLLPGMFGQATIELRKMPESLTLPSSFVRFDESGKCYVYLADKDDKIRKQSVKVGSDDGRRIVILEGITETDRIVVPTARPLREGQLVSVQE